MMKNMKSTLILDGDLMKFVIELNRFASRGAHSLQVFRWTMKNKNNEWARKSDVFWPIKGIQHFGDYTIHLLILAVEQHYIQL